jgi:ubiquinone/menaquinone biosynthesis C-methylase UbiE
LNDAKRLDRGQLAAYWHGLSERHLATSTDGFEVICYAGMPGWFNNLIHHYQVKAFEKLVRDIPFAGRDVLDIGTGVGRWARWFVRRDARVVGIDIEAERLARARRLSDESGFLRMAADELAFPDATFDVVNCVTVLQHVDDATKERAIAEIARVLRPNGRAVIFEVTDTSDDAPHVFPWRASQWRCAFGAHGLACVRTVGTEYIPILRALKRAQQLASGSRARADIDAMKAGGAGPAQGLRMAALRAAVAASYPVEELALRAVTPRAARVNGFLFQRNAA